MHDDIIEFFRVDAVFGQVGLNFRRPEEFESRRIRTRPFSLLACAVRNNVWCVVDSENILSTPLEASGEKTRDKSQQIQRGTAAPALATAARLRAD